MGVEQKQILLILFDFRDWENSKSWSYISSYLIFHELESIRNNNVNLCLIPYHYREIDIDNLLHYYLKDKKWDEAIIWIPHLKLTKNSIHLIDSHVKKKAFFVSESLIYTSKDIAELPHLATRYKDFTSIADKTTPVITLCPITHARLIHDGYNSIFTFGFMPSKKEVSRFAKIEFQYSLVASIYNPARKFIVENIIRAMDAFGLKNSEVIDDLDHISQFEILSSRLESIDNNPDLIGWPESRLELSKQIAFCRQKIWEKFIYKLSTSLIVFSLPSYFKGAPGRVIEGLFAKCCIIFVDTNLDVQSICSLSSVERIKFITSEKLHLIDIDELVKDDGSCNLNESKIFPFFSDFYVNLFNTSRETTIKEYLLKMVKK